MASKYEKKVKKTLEKQGWVVDTKHGMHKWSKNTDFFHLFDIVAIKKGKQKIRWISVKGKAGVPDKHKRAVEKFWMPDNCIKEIWSYQRKDGSPRVLKING